MPNRPLGKKKRRDYFFAWIMLKFRKGFTIKVISLLVAGLFLFNSTVYGIDLPKKACLRSHLLFNSSQEGEDRAREGLAAMLNLEALSKTQDELLDMALARFFIKGVDQVRDDIEVVTDKTELDRIDPEGVLRHLDDRTPITVYRPTTKQLKKALGKVLRKVPGATVDDINHIMTYLISHPGRYKSPDAGDNRRRANIWILKETFECVAQLDPELKAQWARHEREHLDHPELSEAKIQNAYPLNEVVMALISLIEKDRAPQAKKRVERQSIYIVPTAAALHDEGRQILASHFYAKGSIYRWIDRCIAMSEISLLQDLATMTISEMKDVIAEDVRTWIDRCFSRGLTMVVAPLAISAIENEVKGITDEDIHSWINRCIDEQQPYGAAEIAIAAIKKGRGEITIEDIRKLIGKYPSKARDIVGSLGIAAIENGLENITADDVQDWLDKCNEKGDARSAEEARNTGKLAIVAIENGIEGVDASDVIKAINRCADDGFTWPAAQIIIVAIEKDIEGITVDNACALIEVFIDRGEFGTELRELATFSIQKGRQSITATKVRSWINACLDKGLFSDAGRIATSALENEIKDITVDDLHTVIDRYIDKEDSENVREIIVAAIEAGIEGITRDNVRSWIDTCFDNQWFGESGLIAISALENGIEGVTVDDVHRAFKFEKGTVLLVEIVRDALKLWEKGIEGIRDEDIYILVKGLVRKNLQNIAAEMATSAIEKGLRMNAEDVRYIVKMALYFGFHGGAALGVIALEEGIDGITADDVSSWLSGYISSGGYAGAAKLAMSAIAKGIEKVIIAGREESTVEILRTAINKCESPYQAGELVISAIGKGIEGITIQDLHIVTSRCEPQNKAKLIASAINEEIEGVSIRDLGRAIDQCLDERHTYSIGSVGAIFIRICHKRSILALEPKVATAASELREVLSQNGLLPTRLNPFILEMTMGMEVEEFERISGPLDELRKAFKKANEGLEEGRRYDEGIFEENYVPLAYSMEIILPGSIEQMIGLLKESSNPHTIVRFLESKKYALLDEDVTQALIELTERIRKAKAVVSRKKPKIHISRFFKMLDISSSLVAANNKEDLIIELSAFLGPADIEALPERVTGETIRERNSELHALIASAIDELYSRLVMNLLTYLASVLEIEIEDVDVSPDAYKNIYIPFINRLIFALAHIERKRSHKLARFRAFLKATLENRFWAFIEDEEQSDEIGCAIARVNKRVRDNLDKQGLDRNRWLGRQPEHRMAPGKFIYYEESLGEYDPVADIQAVMDYLRRVFNKGLEPGQVNRIDRDLRAINIIPEYDDDQNVIGFRPAQRQDRKKDVINILADRENLRHLMQLTNSLLSTENVRNTPHIRETVEHMRERITTVQERLELDAYRQDLGRMRKSFTVRAFYRNPGRDIFMGDFTDCCLAMNSNIYPDAMVDRLIDEGMHVIEVIDDATEETMACLWLYIAEDGSLVIQNLEINAEYERLKPLMYRVGEGMIGYAQGFAKYIGAPRLLIGMPGHGKYFGKGGFVEKRYGNNKVPFGLEKIGGYLEEKYYLDSAGKPEAYLVAINLDRLVDTAVFFLDEQVRADVRAFEQALSELSNKNNTVVVITDSEDDFIAFCFRNRIDIGRFFIRTPGQIGLSGFNFEEVMVSIMGIENLQCIPLTESICEQFPALKAARDEI